MPVQYSRCGSLPEAPSVLSSCPPPASAQPSGLGVGDRTDALCAASEHPRTLHAQMRWLRPSSALSVTTWGVWESRSRMSRSLSFFFVSEQIADPRKGRDQGKRLRQPRRHFLHKLGRRSLTPPLQDPLANWSCCPRTLTRATSLLVFTPPSQEQIGVMAAVCVGRVLPGGPRWWSTCILTRGKSRSVALTAASPSAGLPP